MNTEAKHELKEPTVEECLAELREMFPRDYWIRIDQTIRDEPCMNPRPVRSVTISIDRLVDDFEAPTLSEAMAQVRKFHDEGMRALIYAHGDAQGQY